jgi:stage IV sporulation protein B
MLLSFTFYFNVNADASSEKIHINDLYLTPGGETIGIEVSTHVIVVDSYSVKSYDGYVNPASLVGIKKGDIILNIDGRKVDSIDDVKEQMMKYNKDGRTSTMNMIIKRDNQYLSKKIQPVKTKDGTLSLGMYLKDNILGIGTLTFTYNGKFGALGHQIKDHNDTLNDKMQDEGVIKKAVVTNIIKGNRGNPGEKKAAMDKEEIGIIQENKVTGIFGTIKQEISNRDKMRIAAKEEVRVGDATILTVIDGDQVEEFTIKIIEVQDQTTKDIKGIKIKVTDERLLDKTGGIIQGMSGSPIIQDNKIVGAVTHVLVDDQTTGYGIFIEFMLDEIGVKVIK